MLIISQDKTQIFNFDNINYLHMGKNLDNDFAVEINYSDCNYNVIARYKTEERAKEVLQEIISEYKKYATISNVAGNDIRGIYNIPKVYEMPED